MKLIFPSVQGLAMTLIVFAGFLNSCVTRPPDLLASETNEDFFVKKVKPVLEYYCIECHNNRDAPLYGGLSMETGEAAMTTGRHVPVIRPGKPDESLLYAVLRLGHNDVLGMPPAPDKVLEEEQAAVRKWILAGAAWPEGRSGRLRLPE